MHRALQIAVVLGVALTTSSSAGLAEDPVLIAGVAFTRDASTADRRALCHRDCGGVADPDLQAFCLGRCERVRDADAAAVCRGDCGAVAHPDLRALCVGQCALARDPDFVALCEGRCDAIRDPSLRAFCAHDCAAVDQSRPANSQASHAMPSH